MMKKKNNPLYSSGLYWKHKNRRTIREIKKKTIKNFRGSDSGIGTSFLITWSQILEMNIILKENLYPYFIKYP